MRASPGIVTGSEPALYGLTGLIWSLIAVARSNDPGEASAPFFAAYADGQTAAAHAKAATHEASVREAIIIGSFESRTADRTARTDSHQVRPRRSAERSDSGTSGRTFGRQADPWGT